MRFSASISFQLAHRGTYELVSIKKKLFNFGCFQVVRHCNIWTLREWPSCLFNGCLLSERHLVYGGTYLEIMPDPRIAEHASDVNVQFVQICFAI